MRGRINHIIVAVFVMAALILPASIAFCENYRVAQIDIKGLEGISEDIVRDVIPFKEGDEFNFEELDKAIGYLRKWGVFDTIEARIYEAHEGVVVEFQVTMALVVTQIDIVGNYPYLENKIKKYLTLHSGDVYTNKRVEDQIERIVEFYNRKGHIDVQVYVEEEDQPFENGVALTFHIKRGNVLRYRDVEVKGNKAYPASRFYSALNTWKPYSERRLRESLRKLKEFYRLHGYPRVKIWIIKKKIDFDARRVDLVIGVKEGLYVKVLFEGNRNIGNHKLRKTITIFKEGSYDTYEIETSVEEIKKLYKERGYPDAVVETAKTIEKNGNVLVVFRITEGKSRIVKKIEFEGNEHVSGRSLKKVMETKHRGFGHKGAFDPAIIPEDSKAVQTEYSKDGFEECDVGAWDVSLSKQGWDLIIDIPIDEGPQTIVSEVEFIGNEAITTKHLLKILKVKPHKPFNAVAFPEDLTRIITYYADRGYPYARVEQNLIRGDAPQTVKIVYDINEGREVRIGRVLIVGDVLTSQKAVKGAMAIKEGAPFSYKKIVESQLNLRRLGAFSAVRVETIGLKEKDPVVHLLVDVDEQRPFLLDLELAYSTDQNFTGALAFRNVNSFGWAKQTLFKITGGRDLARVEGGWLDPRFLGSSFEMSVNLWLQHVVRPAFNYIQGAGSLSFFRRYRAFGFLFRYELDRNYFVEGNPADAQRESLRDNTISKITLSSSYDTRDSFSNPKKGWFTLGQVDFFNEIKGNKANFVKFTWHGENDITVWKRFTLSTGLRFNRIQTFGSNVSVPTNELLFLGGDDTVRGFSEDSLGPVDAQGKATGGRTRWIFNEELRIHLFNHFAWAFFFDMGSLTNTFSRITWNTIRRSAGFGIRYITPVGPVRVDYGIKLDRKQGESFGRLHITFGYMF